MNAVIYARYSSDSQREESIEGQLRECDVTFRESVATIDEFADGYIRSNSECLGQ